MLTSTMAHRLQSRIAKRLLRTRWVNAALSKLVAGYINFVHATTRWQVIGDEHPRALREANKPFIIAFWHGRILLMPKVWDTCKHVSMLISHHRDGRLIADVVQNFGIRTVAGSSSSGGPQALRTIIRRLADGECVGITPDGPRGPRMCASEGFIDIARLAGVPVLMVALSVRRGRLLRTWDRFLLALPFTRGVVIWSAPVTIERHLDRPALEHERRCVEECMNGLVAEADRLCGRDPVEPALAHDPRGVRSRDVAAPSARAVDNLARG